MTNSLRKIKDDEWSNKMLKASMGHATFFHRDLAVNQLQRNLHISTFFASGLSSM